MQGLGLLKTLREYGVPKGDIEQIAARTVGREDEQLLSQVKNILENIY